MQLSIVIVNYNSKRLLENCLVSIKKAIEGIETEIIIVDNNSTDGTREQLPSKFPGVKFIFNHENRGFAKACNQGGKVATGKYILFLNPDTILPETSLVDCVSFFESHPDAGAVGVRMVDIRKNFLKESKRGLPTPSASFYKLFGLSAVFPRSKTFSKYYEGHLPETAINPVNVLSGAFMMIRKHVFEKLNGFDERFFMYGEDIDLSFRILQARYKNYYLGTISVMHLKGGSTSYNYKYVKDFYGAMNLFVKKHYGSKPILFRSLLYLGIYVRKMLAMLGMLFKGKNTIPHIIVYSLLSSEQL
ncbi:MAG TPA: glycosyltransferase family 2 protein [Chitinophagaceae bacterium]|nr:glycosyltransferase family 2 protein [Chitinophagaceae bacterium]